MMIRYDLHIISDSSDRLPWQQRKNSGHGWRSIPFTKALRHYDVIMEEPDKRRIILYYVMQVATGTEDRVEEQVRVIVGNGLYDSCFHPMRRMKKKFRGEWKEIQEKLLPGYVFIRSGCVRELYQELQAVPAFTKLLGKDSGQFIPLSKKEAGWLERMIESPDQGTEVQLSQVSVTENDEITILSGPLKNMEGCIRKIDLHRRIAKVEVDFMNRKTIIHLGIEMVG